MVASGNTKPHAGYGVGNERVLQYILGLTDIRQVSVFSRMLEEMETWAGRG